MTDHFLTAPARVKRAGETKPFTIDLHRYLRSYWIAERVQSAGDYVRSPSVSGFAYQCTQAGETGFKEPAFPRTLGTSVTDGSAQWLTVLPGTNALDPLSGAPTWTTVSPPDSALIIANVSGTNEETTAQFSAGTPGSTYRVHCRAPTLAGNVYIVEFDLEVE
jgi:hypothetical protein